MIRDDCIKLNAKYYNNRQHLSDIIRTYEEFIYNEINTIFKVTNRFSDIVRSHRNHFNKLFLAINCAGTNGNGDNQQIDHTKFCVHISVQEWLLQGQKGQQFQYLVDIDCLNYGGEARFNDNSTVSNTLSNIQMIDQHLFRHFIHFVVLVVVYS